MRFVIAALLTLTASQAFAFSTVPEYQSDFERARECRLLEDGRRVWQGERAYYVQAWLFYTGQSGAIDDEAVSVSPFEGGKPDAGQTGFGSVCN